MRLQEIPTVKRLLPDTILTLFMVVKQNDTSSTRLQVSRKVNLI